MANYEEAKNCKPEVTSSSPATEQQQTSHVYPDHWAAMQAYYGPRMAVSPYFNSPVTSGHPPPPPYMWGPLQHMMPPYAAIYPPHAGVYAHPGVTVAASPMNVDSPAKSTENSDQKFIKKLKGFDGLAMSLGNENGISHSGETEGSSEGSDGNTTEGGKSGQKRSRGGSSTSSEVGKIDDQLLSTNENESFKKMTSATVTPPNITRMPSMVQNERELKRERRKQSNRESARRSRLRKQAEAEGLGSKVESLTNENLTLKSEINRLTLNSSNLKLQNAKLLENLKKAQIEQDTKDPRVDKKGLSLSTVNLLSRVDNGSGTNTNTDTATGTDTDTDGAGVTLRQLLGASPRADVVVAR